MTDSTLDTRECRSRDRSPVASRDSRRDLLCVELVERTFFTQSLTVLHTFSQVFFRRNTDELVKAAQICKTPLKL